MHACTTYISGRGNTFTAAEDRGGENGHSSQVPRGRRACALSSSPGVTAAFLKAATLHTGSAAVGHLPCLSGLV